MTNYAQGPIQPRVNSTVGALPYIKTTGSGTTCAIGTHEIAMNAPYAIFGATADSFTKLFATNYFATQSLFPKNTISGFFPEFYIADVNEIKSTWTPFSGPLILSGSSTVKYEVIYLSTTVTTATVKVNGVDTSLDIPTDISLGLGVFSGGDDIEASNGYYRKLGQIVLT
jgi:hypothetical protein